MTAPAAVLHDRRSPTPRTLAWPLSELIVALLRDGDTHGRYASRSEAVMATGAAGRQRRRTETAWRDQRTRHLQRVVEVLAPARASGPAAAVRASLPWRSGCASPAGALLDWVAQQRRKRGGLRQRNAMLTCPFPLVEGGEA